MKRVALVLLLFLAAQAATPVVADAQTRLGLEVGPLIPIGDFGDGFDSSLWIGARAELQDVNALGQVARASLVLQGGYSSLEPADGLGPAGDFDASYLELGVGARVYSVALPFFVSVGAAWSKFDVDGADGQNGFAPSLGAGLSFGLGGAFVEIEGRGHVAFVGDDSAYDPRFFTLTGAVGLPF